MRIRQVLYGNQQVTHDTMAYNEKRKPGRASLYHIVGIRVRRLWLKVENIIIRINRSVKFDVSVVR